VNQAEAGAPSVDIRRMLIAVPGRTAAEARRLAELVAAALAEWPPGAATVAVRLAVTVADPGAGRPLEDLARDIAAAISAAARAEGAWP
jgi:hypothetical protein